jgi:hypothetical protein
VPRLFLGRHLHFVLIFHIALQERAILIFVILIASCCFPSPHTFSLRICRGNKHTRFLRHLLVFAARPLALRLCIHPTHSLRSLAAPLPRPPVTQHPPPIPRRNKKAFSVSSLAFHPCEELECTILPSPTFPVWGGRQIGHRPQKKQKKERKPAKKNIAVSWGTEV